MLNVEQLQGMTSVALVQLHNNLAAGFEDVKPLGSWKSKKGGLVDKIVALDVRVAKFMEAEVAAERTDAEVDETPEAETAKKEKGPTVRSVALDLLCHIEFHEDRNQKPGPDNVVPEDHGLARSVGLAYDEIIRRIKDRFPECQTTVACLRWYAVKVRAEEHGYEGLRLCQRRPRVKPAGK